MQKSKLNAVYALTFALLAPGALMAMTRSDSTETRKEAVQLTQHVERTGRVIQREADRLDAMRRNHQISNQSHQYALTRIATQINEQLKPAMNRLVEIKPELPQWHQQAIDQMHASAATLASNADAAIVNRNPSGSRMVAALDADYRQYLDNINGRADTLVEIADAAGDYGNAQLKGNQAGLAITAHD